MDHKQTSRKPTSPYSDIIFDMDGVLIDSIELWIQVAFQGLQELNITGTRDDMIKAIVKFETLSKFNIPDLYGFGRRINTLFTERIQETTLQKNILPVLKQLTAAKKRLSVVTSSGRAAVDGILTNLGIIEYFDTIITFDDVQNLKPHPEGIIAILKKHNTNPTKALMVGDTRNDILAGQAAGITTVMYYPDIHEQIYDRDHLLALNADFYIRDLKELLPIILK